MSIPHPESPMPPWPAEDADPAPAQDRMTKHARHLAAVALGRHDIEGERAREAERSLITATLAGDGEAFRALVDLTADKSYGLALRLSPDEHEASDIVQIGYLKAFRSLSGYEGGGRFSTWMYRIITNEAFDIRKKRHQIWRREVGLARPITIEADDDIDTLSKFYEAMRDQRTEANPEAHYENVELKQRLVGALGTLKDRWRDIVILYDVCRLSQREIAESLGTTETAVKVNLCRARRSLREQLQGTTDEASSPTPDKM